MANGYLIDARAAIEMLSVGENELQTLVARGDLRAFRSAGTMKFRPDDVMGLKSEKDTEPTIIIPVAGSRKPGQSDIISAVSAGPSGSGITPTPLTLDPEAALGCVAPGARPAVDATGEILLEDIELMPTDDGLATHQETVVNSAVNGEQTGKIDLLDNDVGEGAYIRTSQTEAVQSRPAGDAKAALCLGASYPENHKLNKSNATTPIRHRLEVLKHSAITAKAALLRFIITKLLPRQAVPRECQTGGTKMGDDVKGKFFPRGESQQSLDTMECLREAILMHPSYMRVLARYAYHQLRRRGRLSAEDIIVEYGKDVAPDITKALEHLVSKGIAKKKVKRYLDIEVSYYEPTGLLKYYSTPL